MAGVRRDLVVGSVRWKIDKGVRERIGHVMRMSDERMTKAVMWLVERAGEVEEAGGQEKKDGVLLEEAVERSED